VTARTSPRPEKKRAGVRERGAGERIEEEKKIVSPRPARWARQGGKNRLDYFRRENLLGVTRKRKDRGQKR